LVIDRRCGAAHLWSGFLVFTFASVHGLKFAVAAWKSGALGADMVKLS
jgi:hypothetical protein